MKKHYTTLKGNRIYMRRDKSHNYTLRKKVNYQDHYFNLGNELQYAKALADKISGYLVFHSVEETRLRFYPNEVLIADSVPKISTVLEWLRKTGRNRGLAPRTLDAYDCAIRMIANYNIVRLADNYSERNRQYNAALEFPISSFNPLLFNRVREHRIRTKGDTLSTKRTLNSMLRNAKAVFHPDMAAMYPEWNPEWVSAFMKIRPYKNTLRRYVLPPAELIQHTFREMDDLEGPVKVCLTLALRAGLRRSEIIHARKSWLLPEGMTTRIYIYPEDDFTPKGKNGYTEIPSTVAADILSQCPDSQYLLGFDDPQIRARMVPNEAVRLLQEWGWGEYTHPLHELRKLFGAFIATTQGLYTAQTLLRHQNPQQTSDTYADRIVDDKVVRLWKAG